jgi:uncharacterized protein YdhG (YjbR/CyaY superfamily)
MILDKPENIDEYIARFPEEVSIMLSQLRECIRASAPDAEEKISYAIPTFYLKGNLVHFAGYRKHVGFYPAPGGIARFQKDLSNYKTSKGAIQFPLDQPLPLKLISKIVQFRVQQNLGLL